MQKLKTAQVLEENMGKSLYNLSMGKFFLIKSQNENAIKD